jgi:hypothetical protein
VAQLVDTSTTANHVGPVANDLYLGIEFESIPGPAANLDNLWPHQIDIGRDIVDWICRTHGIPKRGPPTAVQWTNCHGRWHGILGHADVSRGHFFHTTHRDTVQFIDYIALNVWPS